VCFNEESNCSVFPGEWSRERQWFEGSHVFSKGAVFILFVAAGKGNVFEGEACQWGPGQILVEYFGLLSTKGIVHYCDIEHFDFFVSPQKGS